MANQKVIVSVLADTKAFTAGLGTAAASLEVFGKGANTAANRILGGVAIAGAGLAVGIGAAVKQSSDLNESINAVNVAFGKNSAGILKLGENSAKGLGLAKSELFGIATQFSGFANNIAGEGGDVVGIIDDLASRGADFASVYNLDVADALRKFQSGLAGEVEPLRRFGIDVSAAAVEQFALANNIGEAGRALTEQEKQMARYGLIMQETAKTEGDFANTSEDFANQQRILQSTFKDLGAEVGARFTPALETVNAALITFLDDLRTDPEFAEFIDGVATAFANLGTFLVEDVLPAVIDFGNWIKDNKDLITTIGITLLTWAVAFKAISITMAIVKGVTAAFTTVTTLWSLATGKATIAQLGLNAAMLLNPIAAVIAVIVALVAGLIFFFTQTKTGQKIWADFTKFLGDAWNNVSKFFSDSWKNITKFFSDGFNNVLNFFKNFRGNILNILSGAGSWLLNIGKNVIDGLLNGLKNGFTAVTSFVSNIGSSVMGGIKKIFGIRSPSREMIKLGEYMMEGLGVGLNDTRNLDRAVANVSDRLSFNASAEYGRGGGFGGAGNTYNITVQAVAPNSEVGRTIVEAINEYERTSGRRFVSV
jgi:hypothetical protein